MMKTVITEPGAIVPTKPKSRLRRFARRMIRIIIAVYVALCLIVYFGQNWLIFPGASEQDQPQTRIQYGGDAEVVHLTTAAGIPIAAVFGSTAEPHRPTILYFYGNAGSVAYSEGEFDHFRKLGCNVLIPDLSGFGASGGKASETNFYATADAAWDYLQTRPQIDKNKIIVVGWSMGGGVAVDLASRKPVAGLATFNAFTTLPKMARKLMPWMPTDLFLKYRFDNLAKIPQIHCPMFICNAQLDTLVPPKMSDQLAAAAGGPVTRLIIPTADHNSIFSADPQLLWNALGKWIETISAKK